MTQGDAGAGEALRLEAGARFGRDEAPRWLGGGGVGDVRGSLHRELGRHSGPRTLHGRERPARGSRATAAGPLAPRVVAAVSLSRRASRAAIRAQAPRVEAAPARAYDAAASGRRLGADGAAIEV